MDKQQNIEVRPGDAERPQEPAQRRPAGVAGCRGNGLGQIIVRATRRPVQAGHFERAALHHMPVSRFRSPAMAPRAPAALWPRATAKAAESSGVIGPGQQPRSLPSITTREHHRPTRVRRQRGTDDLHGVTL